MHVHEKQSQRQNLDKVVTHCLKFVILNSSLLFEKVEVGNLVTPLIFTEDFCC